MFVTFYTRYSELAWNSGNLIFVTRSPVEGLNAWIPLANSFEKLDNFVILKTVTTVIDKIIIHKQNYLFSLSTPSLSGLITDWATYWCRELQSFKVPFASRALNKRAKIKIFKHFCVIVCVQVSNYSWGSWRNKISREKLDALFLRVFEMFRAWNYDRILIAWLVFCGHWSAFGKLKLHFCRTSLNLQ